MKSTKSSKILKQATNFKFAKIWTWPSNFNYSGIQYDYDTIYGVEDYGRDSTIENIKITSINIVEVFNTIKNSYIKHKAELDFKEIDQTFVDYCIYRLIVINKLFDKNNWEITKCGGYYGEEIKDILLAESIKNKLVGQINDIFELFPQNRIKYCLEAEYGYVLDSLKNKKFEELEVSAQDLIVGNDSYRKKVEAGLYKNYPEDLPIGIYVQEGEKYRLIDGYHRFVDLAQKQKTVKIISAE